MKRLSVFLFLLLFLALSLSAQITHDAKSGPLDRHAEEVLDKAVKKLSNVSFTVQMTSLDSQKKEVARHKADVRYSGSKYSLAMDNTEVLCDGKTVWNWNKSANEVTINELTADDGMNLMNPGRMLANRSKNFKAKYIRTEDDGTAIVDLQPRSARSFHKVRLFVDEKTGTLKRLEVHKYDSSREIYDFSKHNYGRITGNFTFNPADHPQVEVIDMR